MGSVDGPMFTEFDDRDDMRNADNPREKVLEFLESAYQAGAKRAGELVSKVEEIDFSILVADGF